ncbi:MAG: cation:proton antiporter subunit C [Rickettsiales bacterium]
MSLSDMHYFAGLILTCAGLAGTILRSHLIRKLIALGVFQSGVLVLYVAAGKIDGSAPPILAEGADAYVNPVPHVLMLTAIVVGVAVNAVGLALAVRIKRAYGVLHEDEIIDADTERNAEERRADVYK